MLSNSEPLPEGTVIMADNQFAGRGQQQNAWHAAPGLNLTFSMLLRPKFLPIDRQFMLNIAVCIGINEALGYLLPDGIKVKWPNDIYYHNEKLGGVLIENILSGNVYKASIIGIGINVNQQEFDQDAVKAATSMCKILQQDVNLLDVLNKICSATEKHYLRLKAGNYHGLTQDYLSVLYQFNTPAWYRAQGITFPGQITNVTCLGKLVILVDGKEEEYNFKEVEFLNQVLQ